MGPSSRNNFASLTKSSAASPSSPENRRSLWGLKLCSIGGAGGWPGLSAAFMVKISLCCCLCEDRSRVAAPLILLSQRQSCNGAEWSKDKTQAAESIKWRPQQAYCSNQFLLVQPQTVFSTHTKSSRSRIDKRTARATGNTRYRYSKIAPLDHKMADNCVSLARANTLSSTITKLIKTSKTSNKRYSYHLLNRINKMYTHDLFYLQQEWEAWLAPVYIQIRTTKSQLTQCTKYKSYSNLYRNKEHAPTVKIVHNNYSTTLCKRSKTNSKTSIKTIGANFRLGRVILVAAALIVRLSSL